MAAEINEEQVSLKDSFNKCSATIENVVVVAIFSLSSKFYN